MNTQRLLQTAKLILKAQTVSPGYRVASDPFEKCALCRYYARSPEGECEKYDFAADPDYVCDSYEGREPDIGELRAFVERYGARNSRDDLGLLQQVHDLTVSLGATCDSRPGPYEERAFVERHLPGKHNQKTHGNKYGGGYSATKESLRRLKGDKEARERYKAKARSRAELEKMLTKDVGVISESVDGKLMLTTSYNPDFVRDLKNNIPPSQRKWQESTKQWVVDPNREKEVKLAMEKHFNIADKRKIGADGVRELQQKIKTARIKSSQSYIRKNQDKIRSEIDKLDDAISSYGFNSRSGRKQEAMSNRALLEFALRDMKGNPDNFKDIQQRGIAAAVRYMESIR
jgi:hypothetical protein